MDKLGLILLVFSFVLCCIAIWRAAQPEWQKLIAAAAAFYVAAELFGGLSHYLH